MIKIAHVFPKFRVVDDDFSKHCKRDDHQQCHEHYFFGDCLPGRNFDCDNIFD